MSKAEEDGDLIPPVALADDLISAACVSSDDLKARISVISALSADFLALPAAAQAKIVENHQTIIKELADRVAETPFFSAVSAHFTSGLSLLCYGLGNFTTPRPGAPAVQLALLVALNKKFPFQQPTFFDPLFSAVDCFVLEAFGFVVSSVNDGGRRLLPGPSFFFAPHCSQALSENFLRENIKQLEQIIIIANKLEFSARWRNREFPQENQPRRQRSRRARQQPRPSARCPRHDFPSTGQLCVYRLPSICFLLRGSFVESFPLPNESEDFSSRLFFLAFNDLAVLKKSAKTPNKEILEEEIKAQAADFPLAQADSELIMDKLVCQWK